MAIRAALTARDKLEPPLRASKYDFSDEEADPSAHGRWIASSWRLACSIAEIRVVALAASICESNSPSAALFANLLVPANCSDNEFVNTSAVIAAAAVECDISAIRSASWKVDDTALIPRAAWLANITSVAPMKSARTASAYEDAAEALRTSAAVIAAAGDTEAVAALCVASTSACSKPRLRVAKLSSKLTAAEAFRRCAVAPPTVTPNAASMSEATPDGGISSVRDFAESVVILSLEQASSEAMMPLLFANSERVLTTSRVDAPLALAVRASRSKALPESHRLDGTIQGSLRCKVLWPPVVPSIEEFAIGL